MSNQKIVDVLRDEEMKRNLRNDAELDERVVKGKELVRYNYYSAK